MPSINLGYCVVQIWGVYATEKITLFRRDRFYDQFTNQRGGCVLIAVLNIDCKLIEDQLLPFNTDVLLTELTQHHKLRHKILQWHP